MASLIVTFGRGLGSPPVMVGAGQRSEKLNIAAAASDPVVSELESMRSDNIVDLYAEAKCWVEIGDDPDAEDPGSGSSASGIMAEGERRQFKVTRGQRVSVVAA